MSFAFAAPCASAKASYAASSSASLRRPSTRAAQRRNASVVRVNAAKTADGPAVVIAGITGAVGQEFLRVLKERNFPYKSMKMLASARSAGSKVEFDGETYVVEELTADSFDGQDIALFSAGGSI